MIPAIERLCMRCKDQSYNFNLKSHALLLLKQLQKYVPGMELSDGNEQDPKAFNNLSIHENDEDEDDEDGPIVLSTDEINASLERSSNAKTFRSPINDEKTIHASKYPFLFASMVENEDILMTCARILDEKPDVTSVREAAAYLEEVESSAAVG